MTFYYIIINISEAQRNILINEEVIHKNVRGQSFLWHAWYLSCSQSGARQSIDHW